MRLLKPYCSTNFKGCYYHIDNSVFDRITLSYGFYLRNENNCKPDGFIPVQPNYLFDFPFGEGWYFGVNLRIKCQQGNNQNQDNVDKANKISQYFCKYTIPHYLNNDNDQVVDFFVFPVIKLTHKSLNDFLAGWCNAEGFTRTQVLNIVDALPNRHEDFDIIDYDLDIDSWVNYKMNLFLNLLERIIED